MKIKEKKGFWKKFKEFFSDDDKWEEFCKDKFSDEKFSEHYFIVPVDLEGLSKKKKELKITWLRDHLMSFAMGGVIKADTHNGIIQCSLGKSISTKYIEEKEQSYFLIRFPDLTEKDLKEMKSFYRVVNPKKKRNYSFSVKQSLMAEKILYCVEEHIHLATGIKPREVMSFFYLKNKKPMVREDDGLQYFEFPLEKRIKLGIKYPKLHNKRFRITLKEYINWILEKVESDSKMKEYYEAVVKLIKKYDLKI